MSSADSLMRTPFYFIARRRYREAELAAYLRREHRRGRRLTEILDDAYIERCGGENVLRSVLGRPEMIHALSEDVEDAIRASAPEESR